MAPPRRIVRPQLDMLINFLEENQDAIHGGPQGGTSIAVTRKKWMILAKKLNSVQGGTMKTPEAWKKVLMLYLYYKKTGWGPGGKQHACT